MHCLRSVLLKIWVHKNRMMQLSVVTIFFLFAASGCSVIKELYDLKTIDSTPPNHEKVILNFIEELNTQDNEYESWQGITPQYAYELYDNDFSNVVATLYYMKTDKNATSGYVIIDTEGVILEFSLGEPIYDAYRDSGIVNSLGDKIAYQVSKENLPVD